MTVQQGVAVRKPYQTTKHAIGQLHCIGLSVTGYSHVTLVAEDDLKFAEHFLANKMTILRLLACPD